MPFRFRKSIRLLPGVRLNLSKGTPSVSIGKPGATVNIGSRGARGTVGLPGTGLSYSEQLGTPGPASRVGRVLAVLLVLAAVVFVAMAFGLG